MDVRMPPSASHFLDVVVSYPPPPSWRRHWRAAGHGCLGVAAAMVLLWPLPPFLLSPSLSLLLSLAPLRCLLAASAVDGTVAPFRRCRPHAAVVVVV
jgi:hypothetical protein